MAYSLKKATVLVTGARGFSGSYVVDELLQQGFRVIGLDREMAFSEDREKLIRSTGCLTEHKNLKYVSLDLLNRSALYSFFQESKEIEVILHTASLYDYSASLQTLRHVNVDGTRLLLEAIAPLKLKRFVHWSTCGVFGKPMKSGPQANLPFTEESSSPKNTPEKGPRGTQLVNDYSISKWEQEQLLWKAWREQSLPLTVIRPAPVYGPGSLYGHGGIIQAIGKGWIPAIPSDAKNYITTSVFVRDVARFAVFALLNEKTLGEDFNVVDHSILSYYTFLSYIFLITGRELREIPFLSLSNLQPMAVQAAKFWTWLHESFGLPRVKVFEEQSAAYIASSYWISNRKTLKFGFRYQYADVREGIRDTVEWMRKNRYL